MNEPSDPIDLGKKTLKPGQSVWLNGERFDMPEDEYRLYAERIVEKPLNVRMADYFDNVWPSGSKGPMQSLIDRFDLVERSKMPDPIEVPDWVQRWLDGDVAIAAARSNLKAWIREALVAGAVRVEKPEVPEDVKKAASDMSLVLRGAVPTGFVGTIYNWVLEQVGDSDG